MGCCGKRQKGFPARADIRRPAGDTIALRFEFSFDITGFSFASEIKAAAGPGVALATATEDVSDAVDGVAVLTFSATDTTTVGVGRYRYDVEMTDPYSNVTTIQEGALVLYDGVTD